MLKRRIECSAGKIILMLQGAFKIVFGQLYAVLSTCIIGGLKKTERFKRFTKSRTRMFRGVTYAESLVKLRLKKAVYAKLFFRF